MAVRKYRGKLFEKQKSFEKALLKRLSHCLQSEGEVCTKKIFEKIAKIWFSKSKKVPNRK